MSNTPKLELFESRPLEEVPDLLDHWEMTSLQIDPGLASCMVRTVSFGDLVVSRTSESHGSVANYAVQNDTTVFHFTNPRFLATHWCGLELPHDRLLINPSGRDYVTAQRGQFDCISIQVSNDLLAQQDMLPDLYMMAGDITNRWMVTFGTLGEQFRTWLFNIFEDTDKLRVLVSSSELSEGFRNGVLRGIGEILDGDLQLHAEKVHRQPRRLHLARLAQNLILDQNTRVRSVDQIANELNISPRTLRKLFREVFQTSPYQYILSHRLQCARRRLQTARAGATTVSRVATEQGFEELGRFSQYYRRMFGESPSTTLKVR